MNKDRKNIESIITVPCLQSRGGVASYYAALQVHFRENVRYFFRSPEAGAGVFGILSRLAQMAGIYLGFWRILGNSEYPAILVNTSLGSGGIRRDLALLRMAQFRGRRTIWFFRGWDMVYEGQIDQRNGHRVRSVLAKVNAVIVLGPAFGEKIRSWGYTGPMYVETTTVDDAFVDSFCDVSEESCADDLNCLFLARVEKDKGVFELLEAFEYLHESSDSPVHLGIAGDGLALAEAQDWVRSRNLEARIRFSGYVSGNEKVDAFRECGIYIFPSSHGEGMPNSVLEAMACGLPVITTAVGGLPDFFEGGKMGFMIERPDPKVIAEKVQYLIDHPDERRAMGRYNAEFAKKYFMASVVAKRLERIWESVLDGTAEPGKTYHWRESNW